LKLEEFHEAFMEIPQVNGWMAATALEVFQLNGWMNI